MPADRNHTVSRDDIETSATAAIQSALNACAEVGGGTVRIAAGEYTVRPLELESNVTLHLEAGATLRATEDATAYDHSAGSRTALLVASGAENVAVTGRGTIHGASDEFADTGDIRRLETAGFDLRRDPADLADPQIPAADEAAVSPDPDRPDDLLLFEDCEDVRIAGITIRQSPCWTVHLLGCTDVTVTDLDVRNDQQIPNNDGIVPDKSRNVTISDCRIRTGDDGITLKTTHIGDSTASCENVTVTNCVIESRSCGIIVGGETHYGISHCVFQNCVVRDSNRGLGVRHLDAGSVEHVLFSDIVVETRLHRGNWWGNAEPLYVLAVPRTDSTDIGTIRDVTFSTIDATAEQGAVIYGSTASTIRDLTLDGVSIRLAEGPNSDVIGGHFDLRWITDAPPSTDLSLPTIRARQIPGVYARHVDGLALTDVSVDWDEVSAPYFSHGIECERFSDLRIASFRGRQAPGGDGAAIALREGERLSIRDSTAAPGTETFLALTDTAEERVFNGNDVADATTAITGDGRFEN